MTFKESEKLLQSIEQCVEKFGFRLWANPEGDKMFPVPDEKGQLNTYSMVAIYIVENGIKS